MWKWFQNWRLSQRLNKFLREGHYLWTNLVVRFDKEGLDGDLTVMCYYDSQDEFEKFIRQEYENLGH